VGDGQVEQIEEESNVSENEAGHYQDTQTSNYSLKKAI
jgi:hypothetical protein